MFISSSGPLLAKNKGFTLKLFNDEIIAYESDILQNFLKRSPCVGQFDYAIIKGITSSY